VTDAGVAHLIPCERLEEVQLTGTRSGDGALRALAGKQRLRRLGTGTAVTDQGLRLLHEFPVFKVWQGGEERMPLLGPGAGPNQLDLRGTFTDRGLASLVGLDGLFALNVEGAPPGATERGLRHLAGLPRLAWLACDATDATMPHVAALPALRFLVCQDTEAGDDGWVALSRSRSIEKIWGRRCHNLMGRGFRALAQMPALRALGVSCRNVDEASLAHLPRFPQLEELAPMDVPDEGYRHVGACAGLESLVLMYCREASDRSTEHLTGLSHLRKYFASYNRITDRTPVLLSGIASLEEVELVGCAGLTDAGVAALARLPRLRRVEVAGMRRVTPQCGKAFGPGVRWAHSWS
jgi:hypothetical protein